MMIIMIIMRDKDERVKPHRTHRPKDYINVKTRSTVATPPPAPPHL